MADRMKTTDELERLFEIARVAPPEVPATLAARVLADAVAAQDAQGATLGARAHRRPRWLRQISDALGGWAGLGGLAVASAAGLWIGIAPPGGWPDPAALLMQDQSSYDMFQGEDLALLLDQEEG